MSNFNEINLDEEHHKHLISYYLKLPQKAACTVRIFSHNDFYTIYEEDATMALEFFNTCSSPFYIHYESKEISFSTLTKKKFEALVRELLLIRQYRVEVYQNDEKDGWQLEYKGSPGNLEQFEEILYENDSISYCNSVIALKVAKNNLLGVASVNITECRFEVCEFIDNDCYSDLESVLAQISPRECLLPDGNSPELTKLKTVLQRNGIHTVLVKKSEFDNNICDDLSRLLYFPSETERNVRISVKEISFEHGIAALRAIIHFLNLLGDKTNFNQYKICTFSVNNYVRIDNAALYALNALSKSLNNKSNSLFGVLDRCVTSSGKRLLEQWIKQPLKDLNRINERLEIVECFIKSAETREILMQNCLQRVPDLVLLAKKLACKKAKLQDCYTIYQTIKSINYLIKVLSDVVSKYVDGLLVDPIKDVMVDLERYQSMIEQTLDLKRAENGEFLLNSTHDESLHELAQKRGNLEKQMQKLLVKTTRDLGFDEDENVVKLEYIEMHGYYFKVTSNKGKSLKENKSYRIIDVVNKNIRFTNDKLANINTEYKEINVEYQQQQQNIVNEILDVAAGYADAIRTLNLHLATVDVLVSFANVSVAAKIPYVRPEMHKTGSGILELRKVRHPCLEDQDEISFIPNDVHFTDNKTLYIITGPNMCGKSTYIRSVGVCVLMAHIGCFVPCQKAEISVVDGILARVGADDSQLKGLSTFMMEMIETNTIIESASKSSLVIIDELGRGTSTYDGCGIASSIAEYLATEVKCLTLFATHFHEITKLALLHDSVDNYHVTSIVSDDTMTPLYQIRHGECDKSYGIQCAKVAGLPEDMIDWATKYQSKLENERGFRFIKDFELPVKQKIIKEGDLIIKETLKQLAKCDKESLETKLKELKQQFEQTDNLFIKGLITE